MLQQFGFDETHDAGHELRRIAEAEHAQRTGNFFEQTRNLFDAPVFPRRFDERDDVVLGLLDVDRGLAHQRIEDLAHFSLRKFELAFHRLALAAGTESFDVIVERGFDIQKRAGDIEQRAFVDRATIVGHLFDDRALFADDFARHAETEHAERVADAIEDFGLAREIGRIRIARAQENIERFLDAQQIFLDRDRNRVQKIAVVARHRALRVLQFFLRRQQRVEAIGRAHVARTRAFAPSNARCNREDS